MPLISQTIDDALEEIGVKNPIDEMSPQDHSSALRKLNMIIDSYNTQNLTIPHIQDIEFVSLSQNAQVMAGDTIVVHEHFTVVHQIADEQEIIFDKAYVDIGYDKEWAMASPVDIQGLYWKEEGMDYKSYPMSFDQWNSIRTKSIVNIPSQHYIQKTSEKGMRIYFNCIPKQGLVLHILAKLPYEGVNGKGGAYIPTDDITWGRGFEKMLMYRLAVELCSTYGVNPSQSLLLLANEAENKVKAFNYTPRTLRRTLGNRREKRYAQDNRAEY